MVRKGKDNTFHVECSHCKSPAGRADGFSELAVKVAEEACGYAVLGKFHFCKDCYLDMVSRYESNNVLKESVCQES